MKKMTNPSKFRACKKCKTARKEKDFGSTENKICKKCQENNLFLSDKRTGDWMKIIIG